MTYLVGDSIKLVEFTDRFVTPKYIEWLNDQEINKYLHVGRIPFSKKDVVERNNHRNIFFVMMSNISFDEEDECKAYRYDNYNEYIGTISINSIDWINRKAEIGYMIGNRRYWGMGIATEAVKLASDYCLHRLNLNKVEAGVVDGNIGSIKVLLKNGFKEYGLIPQDFWVDGEFRDTKRFYKLQEWEDE
jgi:ribosomal-protein-alanine N-acetyltransferase